jgi:hypothetical protein
VDKAIVLNKLPRSSTTDDHFPNSLAARLEPIPTLLFAPGYGVQERKPLLQILLIFLTLAFTFLLASEPGRHPPCSVEMPSPKSVYLGDYLIKYPGKLQIFG